MQQQKIGVFFALLLLGIVCSIIMDIKDLDFLHGIGSSLEIMQKHQVGTTAVYTFSYSQKNKFGSKNQEKYADPESTLFHHFSMKIRIILCITIHISLYFFIDCMGVKPCLTATSSKNLQKNIRDL